MKQRDNMRPREILREAHRNIQTGVTKAGWLSAVLIFLIVLLSVAELSTVTSLDDRARTYKDAGGSVRVLNAESDISPQRCDALAKTNGIPSAGALRAVTPIGVASLAGLTTPAFEVTLGFQELIGLPGTLDSGVLVSQPLADRWQVRTGDTLETDQGSIRIAAVFPYREDDGRDSRLANAFLLPSLGQGVFDECWADVWPSTAGFDLLLRATQATGSGEAAASITTLNPTLGLVFTGSDEYQNRITRFAAAAAAAIGFIIGAVGGTRRRLEYASTLHAGVSSLQLTFIIFIETCIWAGFSALLATAGVFILAQQNAPMIADAMYGHFLTTAVAATLGALGGSLVLAASSQEARLFKHFKERT